MKRLRLISIAMVILLSSSIAFAQNFCQGDFNYDGNVDASDVTVFLNHFGRSKYNNPCPPDGPAPVVWSGQMTSYATADDGALQKGVHWVIPRFVDNGNGTLTDKATGLIWLKNANCFGAKPWAEAVANCRELTSGGCGLSDGSVEGDWRLPSIRELHSVIDYSQFNPSIGFFALLLIQNLQSFHYWSSTTYTIDGSTAFLVNMFDGTVGTYYKSFDYYVWPVRGGH